MVKAHVLLPLFIRRGLGTNQFVCRDKNVLATMFVMKKQQNIRESSDSQTEADVLKLFSDRTEQYASKEHSLQAPRTEGRFKEQYIKI